MAEFILLLLIPIIGALILFLLAIFARQDYKPVAIVWSLMPLLLLLFNHSEWVGAKIDFPWLSSLNIHFYQAIDPLSLLFIYLVAFIIPISLFAIPNNVAKPNLFYALILLLEALLFGFFSARDLVFFTFFWEATLIPLYLIMNLWGEENAQVSALKFIIYMIAGSILMIAAVIALGMLGHTFNLDQLENLKMDSKWIFAIFLLAFAVKTPLFPFHAWLPDTYVDAPFAGTILLSGLLSKLGIYGIFRIGLKIFPELLQAWGPYLIGLAIVGVFYGGFAALAERNYKRLLAYSSFSHVNFIMAALFVWSETAHAGAILQALNHGITITALFLAAFWLYSRVKTMDMQNIGGLAAYFPYLCWINLFFVLASIALPGTNNFVGEFLILLGLFSNNQWLGAFLSLAIILSALYMLWYMQKIYFQTPQLKNGSHDLTNQEYFLALPIIALLLWIGIYPNPILSLISAELK